MIGIESEKEIQNREYPTIRYQLNNNVLRSNIISVIQLFENENIKFAKCVVNGFDEDDHVMGCVFREIEDLKELVNWRNPYMSFEIEYADAKTGKYCYTIKAEVNDDRVDRVIYPS